MKRMLILLAILTSTVTLRAQSAEDSVKAAINQFFDALRNVDVALLKNSFSDSAILQTITMNREGKVGIRNEPVSGFANVLSQNQKGDLDERITFDAVKIDGPMAHAWTPYKFFYKGQMSHCGVNSFILVRMNGSWKIQYIIDTRRRQGCE
jgi:ketosteroid isomerase-like protein